MGYDIQCRECTKHTWSRNIVELLDIMAPKIWTGV